MEDAKYVGLSGAIYDLVNQLIKRVAAASPVSANTITVMSFVTWIVACVCALNGYWFATVFLGALSSFGDAFDGAVARAKGEASVKGGFLDFYADRMGDMLMYGALAIHFVGDELVFVAALLNVGFSQFSSMFRNNMKLPSELLRGADLLGLTKGFPALNFRRTVVAVGALCVPFGTTTPLAMALWLLVFWTLTLFVMIYVKVLWAELPKSS